MRYLLIDGLDESLPGLRTDSRGTIVDLLSKYVEQLPRWTRIVATTRREPAVLQRLAGLRARELAAQSPANIDDIENYLRQQLQSPNLSARLTQAGLSLEAAVTSLRDQAAGNFLYAKELLTGVDRDLYDLSDLDALPPGLYGHYQRFLNGNSRPLEILRLFGRHLRRSSPPTRPFRPHALRSPVGLMPSAMCPGRCGV